MGDGSGTGEADGEPRPTSPEGSSPMVRPHVPAADALIGVRRPVLDHGFVALVDYMGNDSAIVQAARVSYGLGTKSARDDRGLIRYLMRHRHTTPFEMVEFKFLVKLPIMVARQMIRHRTACLAEGTRVYFDAPGRSGREGPRLRPTLVEDLWRGFRAGDAARERVRQRPLRSLDERSWTLGHTRVENVVRSGIKPVFRMVLRDGRGIECTKDHRFLFQGGWATLEEQTGLREVGGRAVWEPGTYRVQVNGATTTRPPRAPAPSSTGALHGPGGETLAHPPAIRVVGPQATRRGDRVRVPLLVEVAGFDFVGPRMTYDIEVAGPSHNFVANGIITHNSVNEYSARYSILPDEFYVPSPEEVRGPSKRNRQGREERLPPKVVEAFLGEVRTISASAYRAYEQALEQGVARELARLVLPVNYYTQWYWKTNLHNLLHFLSLRLDPHAQQEIRAYAQAMLPAAKAVAPVALRAFEDFVLEAETLTRPEKIACRALLGGEAFEEACQKARLPLLREDGAPMSSGEGVEFREKLQRIRQAVAADP